MSSLVQRCLPFITLLGLVQPIRSQTVVPVSSKLLPPMGLRFTEFYLGIHSIRRRSAGALGIVCFR